MREPAPSPRMLQGQTAPARPAPMFHRVIEAHPLAVRRTLMELSQRFSGTIDNERLARLELALAEILNNIVEHAYDGRAPGLVHLSVVPTEEGLSCAVADDGNSLPADCLGPRRNPTPAWVQPPVMSLPEGGFGWILIQGLTQDLCYYRENDRNFLAFYLRD